MKRIILLIINLFFIVNIINAEDAKVGIYTKYPWLTDTAVQKWADLESIKEIKTSGLSGATGGDYLSCPDFSTKYFMFFDLYGRFKSPGAGVYVEFWNDDMYLDTDNQDYINNNWVTGHNTKLSILTVTFSDPLRYIWNITLGNLWIDYSLYTISGKWQMQGFQVEGDIDYFTRFNLFIVPLPNDSYVAGAHFAVTIPFIREKLKTDIDLNIVNTAYREKQTDSYVSVNNFLKNNNDIVAEGILTKHLNILGNSDSVKIDYSYEKKEIYSSGTKDVFNEYAGEIGAHIGNKSINIDVSGHYISQNFNPPFKSYWRNYRLQRVLKNNEKGVLANITYVFPWFDITGLADITTDLDKTVDDNLYLIELHYDFFGFNLYPRYEYRTYSSLNGYAKKDNIVLVDSYMRLFHKVGLNLRFKYDKANENGIEYSTFEKWVLMEIGLGARSDLYIEAKVSDKNVNEDTQTYNDNWSQYDEFYWHFDNYLRVRLRLRW